jgi:hypothetical protein
LSEFASTNTQPPSTEVIRTVAPWFTWTRTAEDANFSARISVGRITLAFCANAVGATSARLSKTWRIERWTELSTEHCIRLTFYFLKFFGVRHHLILASKLAMPAGKFVGMAFLVAHLLS